MRIPGKNQPPDRAARVDRAQTNQANKSTAKATSTAQGSQSGSTTATVSAKARSMADEHGFDVEKVDRLRELIQQGAFKMDFMLIAERIVATGG